MIPELGSFAIILSLCFAFLQGVAPFVKYSQIRAVAVSGQTVFLVFAMLCLILSFLNNDMTVIYVREHSHLSLPLFYRIGAAWGGHEGSLLLWCLILSGWTLAFLVFTEKSYLNITSILGLISAGFIAFLLFTSNPFKRLFVANPVSGEDLTPILQDPGLIFHPPMLYMGYVGFAIVFAFAIFALHQKRLDKAWVRACRPWVLLPWSFLSLGIILGSWWAYRELGWGGWWFWDPVENASLLPWLSSTALLHALIVSEKRDTFKGWTLLLAIVTFALSLLGTFLVRSGVLVSVHAFASDPTRGVVLLCYLTLIIGGALSYYAYRIKHFYQPPNFQLLSRETLLLINSVILLTAVATISLGTLYPIILDALQLGKISVGEPYFNTVFIPIISVLLLLMGFAPHIAWGKQQMRAIWIKMRLPLLLTALLALCFPVSFGFHLHLSVYLGAFISLWVMLTTIQYLGEIVKKGHHLTFSHSGMVIAHLGIALLALAVSLNKSYSQERQVKMKPGETIELAGYPITFERLTKTTGENYQAIAAIFKIGNQPSEKKMLVAEERIYQSHQQVLSKPGISINWWRDMYIALGNTLPDGGWSVRLYFKPFVRWIWYGGGMLFIGGLISLFASIRKRTRYA